MVIAYSLITATAKIISDQYKTLATSRGCEGVFVDKQNYKCWWHHQLILHNRRRRLIVYRCRQMTLILDAIMMSVTGGKICDHTADYPIAAEGNQTFILRGDFQVFKTLIDQISHYQIVFSFMPEVDLRIKSRV